MKAMLIPHSLLSRSRVARGVGKQAAKFDIQTMQEEQVDARACS